MAAAAGQKFCTTCGQQIHEKAEICPHCGVRQPVMPGSTTASGKNKIVAGILAILFGWLGAHKFYLGQTGQGILYLIFCWSVITAIIGIIEGVMYLTMSDEAFAAKYG